MLLTFKIVAILFPKHSLSILLSLDQKSKRHINDIGRWMVTTPLQKEQKNKIVVSHIRVTVCRRVGLSRDSDEERDLRQCKNWTGSFWDTVTFGWGPRGLAVLQLVHHPAGERTRPWGWLGRKQWPWFCFQGGYSFLKLIWKEKVKEKANEKKKHNDLCWSEIQNNMTYV